MKKIVLFLFAGLLFLVSCKKSAEFKIALMFPYTHGSRMAIEEKIFREKAAEFNCEVIVTDAQSDEALQRKQANELLAQGVNVIVIMAVNAFTAAEIVRNAHEQGAYVIGYDRLVFNSDLDYYISYNNYNVGKYMADYTLRMKPEGTYVILAGDKSDKNAIFVRNGQVDALKPYIQSGKIKILFDTFIEDWNMDNAHNAMKRYLMLSANQAPDVVLTSYDGLGRGARLALDEAGINSEILITGQDAEPQSIKFIQEGKQTMTIYKPLKQLAENAVIAAVKLAKGEKPDTTGSIFNNRIMVPSFLFDPIVVDKNNIRETVVKDGVFNEADLK